MEFPDIAGAMARQQASLGRAMDDYAKQQSRTARRKHDVEQSTINLAALAEANLASEFHAQLMGRIQAFEAALDQTQDVGVQLVAFGSSITFHVTEVGYFNPSLIVFRGTLDNGNAVELIQHISQLSFLLVAMKRSEPEQPKRKIGFFAPDEQPTAAPGA